MDYRNTLLSDFPMSHTQNQNSQFNFPNMQFCLNYIPAQKALCTSVLLTEASSGLQGHLADCFRPYLSTTFTITTRRKQPKCPMSINRWMDKQNVIFIHMHSRAHTHTHTHTMGYHSALKMRVFWYITTWVKLEGVIKYKWCVLDTKRQILYYSQLHEVPRTVQFLESEREQWWREKEDTILLFKGTKIQFEMMKGSRDGY